ncbi:hypothetical protein DEU56DRAFT_804393 [Suillus clintonianus]|uniref:uncharacterized protein n=1 Tax=Suillus clintonianus TaxID=1904413 RepID=UPI001B8727F8|nr:uncharacterized protein DEU56DRAFT_804393 [Suillus clintonianus]KAG2137545.1 hypothetical protein DEU56DRAFT_804393 [Suillus clintonianus]
MSTPSSLPPFNSSAAHSGMFELSNILGPEWLDLYIRLIPTEMLRTELYLLYFLLMGRIYPGDLWQIVGRRIVEAQNEELLRNTSGLWDCRRRGIVERTFMEERRDRCQMEVSLCSKAIEHIEQRRSMPMPPIAVPVDHDVMSRSATSTQVMAPPAACPVTVQEKCRTWLTGQDPSLIAVNEPSLAENDPPPDGSSPLIVGRSALAHQEKRTSVIVNSIGPSFRLSSTWVTPDVQEAFDQAGKAERISQAGLTTAYLDEERYHIHHRNFQLELPLLRAKMCRARAEVDVYALAIENACAFGHSDSALPSSLARAPSPPLLAKEVARYNEDMDDYSSDSDSDFDWDGFW